MPNAQITTAGADRWRQAVASGHNLLRAGLGAAAQVGAEGRELFDRLVDRGRPLDERRRRAVDRFSDHAGAKVRELGELVQDQVRYDVQQVMERVGIATLEDYKILSARLEALAHKIDELAQHRQSPPSRQSTAAVSRELSPPAKAPVTPTPPRTGAKSAKKKE